MAGRILPLKYSSHDLRGPIGTVKMLASVIARKLPDNQEVHKLTELIEDISKRNIELIKNVLKRETLDTAEVEMSTGTPGCCMGNQPGNGHLY